MNPLITVVSELAVVVLHFEKKDTIYPNVNDGVEGMFFIQQSVASSQQDGAWLNLKHERARK